MKGQTDQSSPLTPEDGNCLFKKRHFCSVMFFSEKEIKEATFSHIVS
jgi:hypothetical protein